jgi:hypothetical protein
MFFASNSICRCGCVFGLRGLGITSSMGTSFSKLHQTSTPLASVRAFGAAVTASGSWGGSLRVIVHRQDVNRLDSLNVLVQFYIGLS